MPRGGTGTCTTPAGQPVVSGTVISDTVFNTLVNDIYTILSDSLSRSGSGSMTVPLQFFDGVIGVPGIAFANEGASGLYRAGANDIRLSINGVDRAKWSTTGFLAAAADIAVLDRAGTIAIGTTSGTTITLGRAGQVLTIASTLDAAVIDRAGTIGVGTTSGTTITIGRSGQTVSFPNTIAPKTNLPAVGQQVSSSCGTFTTATGSFADVTNLSVTITTVGRPVLLIVQPDGTANSFYCSNRYIAGAVTFSRCYFQFLRGASVIASFVQITEGASANPLSNSNPQVFVFLDTPGAGTYTYKMQAKGGGGDATAVVENAVLIAYEL